MPAPWATCGWLLPVCDRHTQRRNNLPGFLAQFPLLTHLSNLCKVCESLLTLPSAAPPWDEWFMPSQTRSIGTERWKQGFPLLLSGLLSHSPTDRICAQPVWTPSDNKTKQSGRSNRFLHIHEIQLVTARDAVSKTNNRQKVYCNLEGWAAWSLHSLIASFSYW